MTKYLGVNVDTEKKYNELMKMLGLPNTGTTYEAFKAKILSAESMDELNNIRAEYSAADLTEEDKQMLGEYARARYGNHIS